MPWDYGWHMGWMMTGWSIVWVLIVLGMIWVVLRSSGMGQSDSPEGVLKRRYAHGDIDREEYERRLNDLRK
jgi:putative membrane protein